MSLKKVFLVSFSLLLISSIISCLIGINNSILVLNENQIFYLYSTSAQVLAGVYGLTLAGFIFFRNELRREELEDDTLSVVIEGLKKRYFINLLFVTILSIFTLVMCNIVISSESEKSKLLISIFMNVTQSSFVMNLLVIAYFIFDVIAPKRIEKESKSIQNNVDPIPAGDVKGNIEDFLRNYNRLEYIIQKYGKSYQSEFGGGISPRRISNIKLAEFILRAQNIDHSLYEKIKNLIILRNSIIHGAEPVVSKHMVEESKKVLNDLEEALKVK